MHPLKYDVDHSSAILPRPMGCCSYVQKLCITNCIKNYEEVQKHKQNTLVFGCLNHLNVILHFVSVECSTLCVGGMPYILTVFRHVLLQTSNHNPLDDLCEEWETTVA